MRNVYIVYLHVGSYKKVSGVFSSKSKAETLIESVSMEVENNDDIDVSRKDKGRSVWTNNHNQICSVHIEVEELR